MSTILIIGGVDLSDYVVAGMTVTETPVLSDAQTLDEMYAEAENTVLFTAVSGKKIYDTPTGDPPEETTSEEYKKLKGKSVSISANLENVPEDIAEELFNALENIGAENKVAISYAAPCLTNAAFTYPTVTSEIAVEPLDSGTRTYDIKISAECPLIPFENAPEAETDSGANKGRAYTLSVGGEEFDEDSIANITYSAAAPNHGMSGISSASFSCDIFTGAGLESTILELPPCSVVTFSELAGEFILTDMSFIGKGTVSITAYRKFVNADVLMDTSTFPEKDSSGNLYTYSCKQIAIAALGTLYGTGAVPSDIAEEPYLQLSEFKGKTVRSVLEEISKVNGGFFCESSLGGIDFLTRGGGSKGSITVTQDMFSDYSPEQTKTISRVFVTDSSGNNTYEAGDGAYFNTVTLSGSFLKGKDVCLQAASKLIGEYKGWECDDILTDELTPALYALINFDGVTRTLEKFTVKYTKNHSVMSGGADYFQSSFADYTSEMQRAVDTRVKLGQSYKNSGIDNEYGFYFTMEETDSDISAFSAAASSAKESYYFSTKKGGFTSYDGVQSSAKEAAQIEVDKDAGR